jgi:hypothetical protein
MDHRRGNSARPVRPGFPGFNETLEQAFARATIDEQAVLTLEVADGASCPGTVKTIGNASVIA